MVTTLSGRNDCSRNTYAPSLAVRLFKDSTSRNWSFLGSLLLGEDNLCLHEPTRGETSPGERFTTRQMTLYERIGTETEVSRGPHHDQTAYFVYFLPSV